MPFDGPVTELPCGRAGMVNHENRLLSDPLQLLTAEGVSYEDDHVQRERGASAYDALGVTVAPQATGTFSGGGIGAGDPAWEAHLITHTASGTPAFVTSLGTATDTLIAPNDTGTLTLTIGAAGVPIGDVVYVALADTQFDYAPAVVDSKGNTWTAVTTSSTTTWRLFRSTITVALVLGDTITVSTSITGEAIDHATCLAGIQITGVAGTPDQTIRTSGASATPSVGPTSPTASIPILALNVTFYTWDTSVTFTQGAGFTVGAAVATTGAALVADDRGVAMSYRVFNTTPRICAIHDWASDQASVLGAGSTVTINQGSTTTTGTVSWTSPFRPGDYVYIAGQERIVASVTSTTVLDTTEAWESSIAVSSATIYRRAGRRMVTATTAGNVFKESPTSTTAGDIDAIVLVGGLTEGVRTPGFFLVGGKEAGGVNRKLFYYNGADPIQVLDGDGSTMSAIDLPPSDFGTAVNATRQPVAGVIHNFRHVAFGTWQDPHRLYFSSPDDHEDFTTDPFSVRLRSDVGDRLYAATSFNGVLFAWKYPYGVFWLDDSDVEQANWIARTKSTAIGCAPSPYAICPLDDDVLFCAANGSFHLLSAVDALGGTKASDLTHALGLDKWLRDNVNLNRLDRMVSTWNQHRRTAIFYVPGTGQTQNTLALKFDFGLTPSGGPVRFGYSTRDAAVAVTKRRPLTGGGPDTPIIGQSTIVYALDQSTTQKAGANYQTQIQTPHLDLSWVHPSYRYLRKIFRELELVFEPSDCGGTATVDVYVDAVLRQTLTYDPTQRRQKKHLTVGDGHTISVRVTKSDSTNMKLLSMILYFHPGNEDQSR